MIMYYYEGISYDEAKSIKFCNIRPYECIEINGQRLKYLIQNKLT